MVRTAAAGSGGLAVGRLGFGGLGSASASRISGGCATCPRLACLSRLGTFPGHGLDGRTGADFLEAFDDELVACLDTLRNDVAFGRMRADLHRDKSGFAVFDQHQCAVAICGALNGLLRHHQRLFVHALFEAHAHIQTRQQRLIGVGEQGPQIDLAGARINRHPRKQQFARVIVDRVAVQQDFGPGIAIGVWLNSAFGHLTAQGRDLADRLGDVDVDLIQAMDRGQGCGRGGADQGTDRDLGFADGTQFLCICCYVTGPVSLPMNYA